MNRGTPVLLIVLAACTPGASTIEETSASMSLVGECDTARHRPILFDDFRYDSLWRDDGEQEAALFSPNAWVTCSGTDTLRMWYRYNHDDLVIGPSGSVEIVANQAYGSVLIRKVIMSGHSGDRDPILTSGSETATGTYAARVRFSDLALATRSGIRVIQAFWMQEDEEIRDAGKLAPGVSHEIDFEWNNFFHDSDGLHPAVLDVVNHGSEGASPAHSLDCYLVTKSDVESATMCLRGERSYIIGEIAPGLYEKEWWVLSATHYGDRVSYAAKNGAYGGTTKTVIAGSDYRAGIKPVVIEDYTPSLSMNVRFGILMPGRASSKPMPNVSDTLELEIDWMYFSPDTNLTIDSVISDARRARAIGSRINTAGVMFE